MIPDKDRVTVLLDEQRIQQRIRDLGQQITADYHDRDLTLIGILKGSVPFLADLMRAIDLPLQIDFLELSSYGGGTESSGVVRLVKDLSHPIADKHVLIVEDIVDTGLTLTYLRESLGNRGPASLGIATLLDKPEGRLPGAEGLQLEYVGFEIPKHFVVGYGLDLGGYFRNLPFVGEFHPPEEG
jgi:hypoxanthine phosphoribosyltransferase